MVWVLHIIIFIAYVGFLLGAVFPYRSGYGIHEGRDFVSLAMAVFLFFVLYIVLKAKPRILHRLLNTKVQVFGVLLAGLILRTMLLFAEPHTQDLSRYISDGKNLAAGNNPYLSKVDANVPHNEYRSFYPILAQTWFALGATLYPSPWVYKLMGGLTELFFLIFFLCKVIQKKATSIKHERVLLVFFLLFNPLSLHIIWAEGHMDFISVLPVILALKFSFRKKGQIQSKYIPGQLLLFLLSGLLKFYGFIFLLLAWYPTRKNAHRPLNLLRESIFLRNILLIALFFWIAIFPIFYFQPADGSPGVHLYFTHWQFGSPLISIMESLTGKREIAMSILKFLTITIVALLFILFLNRKISHRNLLMTGIATILFLFNVQHAWYYFLLLPLVIYNKNYTHYLAGVIILAQWNYLHYLPEKPEFFFFLIWSLPLILHKVSGHSYRPG